MHRFLVVIHKEDDLYLAHCPGIDVTSQGETAEEARQNVAEAVELVLETASPAELKRRLANPAMISEIGVSHGETTSTLGA